MSQYLRILWYCNLQHRQPIDNLYINTKSITNFLIAIMALKSIYCLESELHAEKSFILVFSPGQQNPSKKVSTLKEKNLLPQPAALAPNLDIPQYRGPMWIHNGIMSVNWYMQQISSFSHLF